MQRRAFAAGVRNRSSLTIPALALLVTGLGAACGTDGSGTGETPATDPPVVEPEKVTTDLSSASLRIDGERLILTVTNLADAPGTVSVSTMISTTSGIYVTDEAHAPAEIGSRQSIAIALVPAEVRGLSLREEEWTDARASYEVRLSDGRADGAQVSVFAEHGVAAAPRPVIPSVNLYGVSAEPPPDEALPDDRAVEKASANVKFCFRHQVGFNGVNEGAPVAYLANRTATDIPAKGMFVLYKDPANRQGSFLAGNDGCKTLPRQNGSWTFTATTIVEDWPVNGNVIVGWRAPNDYVRQQLQPVNVQNNTGTTTQIITIPVVMGTSTSVDAGLQSAMVIAQNAIHRSFSLGNMVPEDAVLNLKSTLGFTSPCSPADDCQTGSDIYLSLIDSFNRRTVAHEVGHWIHELWVPNITGNDYTYINGTDQWNLSRVPPNDGCVRTTDGSHALHSIEWDGAAHVEGFAHFISMLAYNNINGSACGLVNAPTGLPSGFGFVNRDCEAAGRTLERKPSGGTCWEWNNFFGETSNEYDWAKMYWDLFTDERGNFGSLNQPLVDYLTVEASITGWNRANHQSKIFAKLAATNATWRQAMVRASNGNIFQGTDH